MPGLFLTLVAVANFDRPSSPFTLFWLLVREVFHIWHDPLAGNGRIRLGIDIASNTALIFTLVEDKSELEFV